VNRTQQDTSAQALSRRSLLQSAAGAGLAATAVATLGTALSSTAASGTAASSTAVSNAAATATAPLVVHVRDITTGDIEVFSGTSQTRVRDRALATRIAQAIS
jgi:hypothetical protein